MNRLGSHPACNLHGLSTLLESVRAASPSLTGRCHLWETCSEHGKIISRHPGGMELQMRLHEVVQHPQAHCNENPERRLGIEVLFRKKPNDISTGSRYQILTGAQNATTPKEPQWSEETDQPQEEGDPDRSKASEPRKNLPRDNRYRRNSNWGRLVRIFDLPIIKRNPRLRNSRAYRGNDSRGQSS